MLAVEQRIFEKTLPARKDVIDHVVVIRHGRAPALLGRVENEGTAVV
jgi:hypothetical protein